MLRDAFSTCFGLNWLAALFVQDVMDFFCRVSCLVVAMFEVVDVVRRCID